MPRQIPDHSLESVVNDGDLFLLRRVSDGVDVKIPGSLILRAAQLAANGGTIPETNRTNTFSADQAMGGFKITGLGAPVADEDAARKGDLDAAAGIFTEFFESAEQTITTGSAITVAHGLSGIPTMTDVIMRCKTAEGGYSIGDEISVNHPTQSGSNVPGVSGVADGTNVVIVVGSSFERILNKSTGAAFVFTAANWRLVARAWR